MIIYNIIYNNYFKKKVQKIDEEVINKIDRLSYSIDSLSKNIYKVRKAVVKKNKVAIKLSKKLQKEEKLKEMHNQSSKMSLQI